MRSSTFKLAAVLARRKRRAASSEVFINVCNVTRQTRLADRAQLAGDGRNRRKGLLGRDGLASGEGLWIVPCEAVHTFGMRFRIDLVFLDRANRIVKIRSDVGPWRLSGCLRAHSVLELPAGTIRDTQTMTGDNLVLDQLFQESAELSNDRRPQSTMLKFRVILKHLLYNEEGQDLIEYFLIVALLSLACISGVSGFGIMVAALCDTLVKAASQLLS